MEELKLILDKELDSLLVNFPKSRKSAKSFTERLNFIQNSLENAENKFIEIYSLYFSEKNLKIDNDKMKEFLSSYLKKYILSINSL